MRPPVTKSYRSLQATLEGTAVPQMLWGEDWEAGRGVDVHLALAALLDFEAGARRWSRLHDEENAGKVVALVEGLSEDRRGTEGRAGARGSSTASRRGSRWTCARRPSPAPPACFRRS